MNYVIQSLAESLGVDQARLQESLSGWEAHDYLVNNEVVGTAMTKGTEIHFAINPAKRRKVMRRGNMREAIRPLFEELGFLTTRILIGHTNEARFVERVGFEKTTSDGKFDYYLLANLPFERNAK